MAPKVFISYSWDSEPHRIWVRDLSSRLRSEGIDAMLDQWHAVPGDQLPAFMETAVRESDFVLLVCTPRYKEKSDKRTGGVGYEGGVMTSQLFVDGNERKFIPILRSGSWPQASPSWVAGKYFIDLSGSPYSEVAYADLLSTVLGTRPLPPELGRRQSNGASVRQAPSRLQDLSQVLVLLDTPPSPNREEAFSEFHDIQLHLETLGVRTEEIDEPKNPSISPLIEYSSQAAAAALQLREQIAPILMKYRQSMPSSALEVTLRKRMKVFAVVPRLWLHL